MKRILFLPFFAVLTTPALMAATTWEPNDQRFSTDEGYNNPLLNGGVTDFVGNIRQVKDGNTSYTNGLINIGTYAGEGTLTIDTGITANAENCVFIGGRGYHTTPLPEDKPALDESDGYAGTLNVNRDAVFSNGTDKNLNTYLGAQFVVGHGDAEGTLNIDGGTVNSNGGMFVVGNSERSVGVVNITNGGILNANLPTNITQDAGAGWFILGNQAGAKGTVNVESGSSLIVSSDRSDKATMTYIGYAEGTDCAVNVSGGSTVDFGAAAYIGINGKGTLKAQDENTVIETGSLYILNASSYAGFSEGVTVNAANDLYVAGTLENSGSLTIGGNATFAALSSTTNNGTIQARDISVEANAVLTNTGVLESVGGQYGIYLFDGAAINNEGSLSGTIAGVGTVYGAGEIENLSVGSGTRLAVAAEDAPIRGMRAGNITLMEGSITRFNVAGSNDIAVDSGADWDSGMHSIIFGDEITIQSGALIEIVFNEDMFTLGKSTELELLLFSGSEAGNYNDLTTLMANTTFSLHGSASARSTADTLTLHSGNLSYQARDNGLYLVGSAMVTIPEPSSATLSLLALGALAARRRRK